MQVLDQPVDTIRPYDRNPRTIPPEAIDRVATSIRTFGFRQPIVVDADGVIIVGHTRYLAAKQLGLAEVPVHVAEGLTPEQVAAYRVADNKTGEASSWDDERLTEILGDLTIDLREVTGFDSAELDRLLGTMDSSIPDPAEPADHANEPVPSVYEVIVAVADEVAQEELFERLKAEGYRCRVLTA